MSDAVLAVPFSRLFAPAALPAGPSPAARQQAAVEAAFAAGEAAGAARLLPRIAALEAEVEALTVRHGAELAAEAERSAAALAALEAALAGAVASIGLAAARAVLAREPALGADTLGALVAEALAGLPDGQAGTLRMHPDDAVTAPALPQGWAVLADPALAPGEMVAERGPGLSAAGVQCRLEQLARRLEVGV
jgi:flagellar biosynthesis/type III secretory pathway protein FliH